VLMLSRPSVARSIMLQVWKEINAGRLPALPRVVYPINTLPEALQFMSEGVHIGKILISMDSSTAALTPTTLPPPAPHIVCGLWDPASLSMAFALRASQKGRVILVAVPGASDSDEQAANSLQGAPGYAFIEIIHCEEIVKLQAYIKALEPADTILHVASGVTGLLETHWKVAQHLHDAVLSMTQPPARFVTLVPALGGPLSCLAHGCEHRVALDSAGLQAKLHMLAATRRCFGLAHSCCICVVAPKLVEPDSGWKSSSATEEAQLLRCGVRRVTIADFCEKIMCLGDSVESTSFTVMADSGAVLQSSVEPICMPLLHNGVFVSSSSSLRQQLLDCIVAFIAGNTDVAEAEVGLSNDLQQFGLDSLSLIALSTQLRGLAPQVSVLDIMESSSIAQLVANLSGEPLPEESSKATLLDSPLTHPPDGAAMLGPSRPQRRALRILALHGFRTSDDLMEMQMASVKEACRAMQLMVEVTYLRAPQAASGPGDAGLPPELPLWEWYGECGEDSPRDYLAAWKGPRYDGLEASLQMVENHLQEHGPYDGICGFSQGAAVATAVLARGTCQDLSLPRFALLFSGIALPSHKCIPVCKLAMPCLQVYDPREDYAFECHLLHSGFEQNTVIQHPEGHLIPSDSRVCGEIATFVLSLYAAES